MFSLCCKIGQVKKRKCSWRKARERTSMNETYQTTKLFSDTKMTMHFLSQARAMRSALVNRLYCTGVCCEWVSCLHFVLCEVRFQEAHTFSQVEPGFLDAPPKVAYPDPAADSKQGRPATTASGSPRAWLTRPDATDMDVTSFLGPPVYISTLFGIDLELLLLPTESALLHLHRQCLCTVLPWWS